MTSSSAPILVFMGVSSTGKSTVAALLAGRLGWPFQEGDDLHPQENVAKMAAGHALNDDDRGPWLDRVAAWIDDRIAQGEPGIITCSALKRRYRDVLRRDNVTFVHLTGERAVILDRMMRRQAHFMPPALLDSQFAALEMPGDDEQAIAISVELSPAEQAAEVATRLRLVADA